MSLTRSRFYVDLPLSSAPPTQRHSMYANASEISHSPNLQDLSSASSATTLPSTAGSVDRLTGSKEKKDHPRFFTLKPKTSFSLRPFFSSSSIPSLSPSSSKRNRKQVQISNPRRDSYAQTDQDLLLKAYGEVGVQTLNASTVDVPVQTTCEWEVESGRRPFVTGIYTSRFLRSPSAGNTLNYSYNSNLESAKSVPKGSAGVENPVVTPLSPSKLLKYASPNESTSPAEKTFPDISGSVNDGYPGTSQETLSTLSSTRPCSVEELKPPPDVSGCSPSASKLKLSDVERKPSDGCKITTSRVGDSNVEAAFKPIVDSGKADNEAKDDSTKSHSIVVVSQCIDRPPSALKIERTDSPIKHTAKIKTVHFDLSDEDTTSTNSEKQTELERLKKLDKDFEALLINLGILEDTTELTEKESATKRANTIPDYPPKETILSTKFKSSFDILHEDTLPPILENSNETPEAELHIRINKCGCPEDKIETINANFSKNNVESSTPVTDLECSDELTYPSGERSCKQDEEKNELKKLERNSEKCASFDVFTPPQLDLKKENSRGRINVYDSVVSVSAQESVSLPTLPSFFESSLQVDNFPSAHIANGQNIIPVSSSVFPNISDTGDKMLSRSSSRSSMRSNPRSEFNELLSAAQKFDSCENLDQLEEEIIRSLCESDQEEWDNQSGVGENILSDIVDTPLINATHRRVILDRILSGEDSNLSAAHGIDNTPHLQSVTKTITHSQSKMHPIEGFERYENDVSIEEAPYDSIKPTEALTNVRNLVSSSLESNKNFKSVCISSEYPLPVHNQSDFAAQEKHPKITSISHSHPSKCFSPNDSISCITSSLNSRNTEDNSTGVGNSKDENCNYTNCLRPSDLKKTQFINKITFKPASNVIPNQKSMPNMTVHETETKNEDEKIDNKSRCDYGNCLKPSQVQNSIFKTELAEITANKSLNNGANFLRTRSPSPVRSRSPLIERSPSSLSTKSVSPGPTIKIENNKKTEYEPAEKETCHRSEVTIVLQSPNKTATHDSFESSAKLGINHDECNEVVEMPPVYSVRKESLSNRRDSENGTQSTLIPNIRHSETNNFGAIPAIPPPPPPPPPSPSKLNVQRNNPLIKTNANVENSLESAVQNQRVNLVNIDTSRIERPERAKTPVMLELERHLERRRKSDSEEQYDSTSSAKREVMQPFLSTGTLPNGGPDHPDAVRKEEARPTVTVRPELSRQNGFHSEQRYHSPPASSVKYESHTHNDYVPTHQTILTDADPPPGAILLDKKVTVEGDKVHTDKYYAIPMKEVLTETTTTTKFIPAPPKYEGIGPTEDGVPIGLRNSVKKENMHNWYKTMFKSLHKADSSNDPQEYVIGYSSEPETSRKDMGLKEKSSTLDNRQGNSSKIRENLHRQGYPASAKSSIEVYNVRPRLIEDYEPGYSSVTDDENTMGSRRFLPPLNSPKPSYEFKNGYEQENNYIRNLSLNDEPDPEQQRVWYKEIQKGGDVPPFGLGKPAPEKPKEPVIGPLPPPPLNYTGSTYQQATRPTTLPANYQNDNGLCQQSNGFYELQMRQAIHSEMQHRVSSPVSSNLSSPSRSMLKSPSRSPDLKIPAQALFDFKAESSKELGLRKGDSVLVLRQLDKNWYEGERQGTVGIFPVSYVEIVPPEHTSTPVKVPIEGSGRVLFDFYAKSNTELSVHKGDVVRLLRKVDSNWYEAQFGCKRGIIPVSYLQITTEPSERSTLSPSKSCLKSPRSTFDVRGNSPKNLFNSSCVNNNLSPNLKNDRCIRRGKKGSSLIEPVMYKAIYGYSPQNSDELELLEGDTIYVVEMCDDGWFVGTSVRTGVFGIFPGNYVEKV